MWYIGKRKNYKNWKEKKEIIDIVQGVTSKKWERCMWKKSGGRPLTSVKNKVNTKVTVSNNMCVTVKKHYSMGQGKRIVVQGKEKKEIQF